MSLDATHHAAISVPRTKARVLADVLPGGLARDVLLVAATVLLLIGAGQVTIPLPWTPVPLSLGTFAVIASGAALGSLRGFASVAIYFVAGIAGAPIFAQHTSGWHFASFGYLIGMLVAAPLVGLLAERGWSRTVPTMAVSALIGSLVVYAFGVPWLMHFLDVDFAKGLSLGVTPFLVGDGLKIAAIALLLPAGWKLLDRR